MQEAHSSLVSSSWHGRDYRPPRTPCLWSQTLIGASDCDACEGWGEMTTCRMPSKRPTA
ncbi:MAG: hypothetical protein QOH74_1945 [Gaiellales bacterium]|jgi:hypothetical protein|nr:hypothetical protein [Gaiellales bacterium]